MWTLKEATVRVQQRSEWFCLLEVLRGVKVCHQVLYVESLVVLESLNLILHRRFWGLLVVRGCLLLPLFSPLLLLRGRGSGSLEGPLLAGGKDYWWGLSGA